MFLLCRKETNGLLEKMRKELREGDRPFGVVGMGR